MTTSGISTGVMTVAQTVQAALEELGILSAGETADGSDLEVGIRVLNAMLKSWAADGINMWREQDAVLAFAAGQATIALTPRCLDVLDARLVIVPATGMGYERQLQRWELGQYRQIPNKQAIGWPTAFVLARTVDGIGMTVWPVPVNGASINCTYSRVPDDVTDGAETLDIPQEWMETVYLNLAARLASMYGVTRSDAGTVQLINARATDLKQRLLDQDRSPSIFMGSAISDPYF